MVVLGDHGKESGVGEVSGVGESAGRSAQRRSFPAEYKINVLRIAESLKGEARGQLAAFLRAEGLRTSHVAEWRKQCTGGVIGSSKRGRREKPPQALFQEIRLLKYRLATMEERALRAEEMVRLQVKYVKAAALKLNRKDRGLLSELIAQLEGEPRISSLCDALALTRRDFYRTILPRIAAK
jgi:transposase